MPNQLLKSVPIPLLKVRRLFGLIPVFGEVTLISQYFSVQNCKLGLNMPLFDFFPILLSLIRKKKLLIIFSSLNQLKSRNQSSFCLHRHPLGPRRLAFVQSVSH